MKNKKLITIGLPVYNAEIFIRDTIKSILNQSYKDFRLIIIDDGSTDNSISIIKTFKDPRIELIVDGQNKGLPYRLNQIADLTETKYLARMDADDIMHPDRLRIQIKVLEDNPKIDLLGTNAYSIDESNKIKGVRNNIEKAETLKKVKSFIHPTIMGKTDWFVKNKYDKNAIRIEDEELWSRTHNKSCFMTLNTPLLYYREFNSNYYMKYFKSLEGHSYVAKKIYRENFINYIPYILKSYFPTLLKGCIYKGFSLFNYESFLINKRNIILGSDQMKKGKNNLLKSLKFNN